MKVLAVDTSTKVGSVSLCDDSGVIAEFTLNHKMTHSQQLIPLIQNMLSTVSYQISDVDLFAISQGPGSFTGLRIGLTTIKAFAYAMDKPIACVNTLEALAYNIEPGKFNVCPIIDARNNQVFTAIYKPVDNLYHIQGDYMAIEISELVKIVNKNKVKTIFTGDGVNYHRDYLQQNLKKLCGFANQGNIIQRASIIAYLARMKYNDKTLTDCVSAVPYYCRKSQAEQEFEKKAGLEVLEKS